MSEKRKKPTTKKKAAPRPYKQPKHYATYQANPSYRGGRRRKGRVKKLGSSTGSGWAMKRRIAAKFSRMALAAFIIGGLAIVYFAARLPDISAIDTIRKQQGITVQAADGHTIANYGDVYGEYIPYEQLPKHLIQAVIATEDRRFFEHNGIDIWGILRAMVTNVRRGHLVQGGSTVTQQVAKNVFLTPERSIARKVQEVLLAFWLEARFTKKEIMAIYLNRVYLGAGTFGVDAAAKRYYNKSARDLTLEESALLAGLLKAPSRYSPASNSARARERMHQVLINMEDAGFIKQKQVELSMATYTKAPSHQVEGGDVRYFTDWVIDEIPTYVGQVDEDMVITTTLDRELQTKAQDALQTVVSKEGPPKNASQGAIVAMTPDGAVQAMVGGMSYAESQYNRAAQAKRQPGSVFKVFVYLAALEAGMTPQSTVEDAPITLQVGNKLWSPDNYSNGQYLGEIPMVQALRNSLNTVSVRLSQYTGVGRVAQMAMRLGIPNVPERPSIALGAVEATLVEMTGAYAHLANNGNKVVPYAITSIRTRKGAELYAREKAPSPTPVLAKGTVEMMNYMLLDVVNHGTGIKARLGNRPVAGKTGTSQNYKDAWFIGFTPQLVAGVWVGNDDNKPMKKITGGSIPTLVWHEFMVAAMKDKPVLPIPNNAASNDGLLPWLFGGSGSEGGEQPATGIPAVVPEDAPFGSAVPADMPVQPAPSAAYAPTPQNAPAEHSPDVLTPQFWNTLMDKAPAVDKRKLEYSYPGEDRKRGAH